MIGTFEKFRLNEVVSYYQKKVHGIRCHLEKDPDSWGVYQKEFNSDINHFFAQVMAFEKRCIRNQETEKFERVKNFFVRRFRKYFYYGDLSKWSIDKPFGYSGDFRVIDAIYENRPRTKGYDRLFDNYFEMSAISIAVRNRKEDFKRKIVTFLNTYQERPLRIMNLASGPCREIIELYQEYPDKMQNVVFDCYDSEKKAHRFAAQRLNGVGKVNFFIENALKIALSKDVSKRVPYKYDFIYSMGLFDYLKFDLSVRLVQNLRNRLKSNGELHIADVRDRYYNPSVLYMEWGADWNLVYRPDKEFAKIFLDAGFSLEQMESSYEQQGIMQYIRATK